MDKRLVYETVGKAIKAASGKTFSDAQKLISEAVLALTEKPADLFVVGEAEPAELPASIIRPTNRITTLKPVIAPPARSIVKEVWTQEQVQAHITNNTPEELSFIPDGTDKEARLTRVITVDTNKPPTIQLSYRPSSNDPDIPYPKFMLFTTDEEWDWEKILSKMTKDAASMYRMRTGPIRVTKVSNGGRVTFDNKAEV